MRVQVAAIPGPLNRGPNPLPGPLYAEGTEKGTQQGTEPDAGTGVSLEAMRGFGHKGQGTEKGTQQGTEPLPGPLVPSPSIRGEGQGTEGQTGEQTDEAEETPWTVTDSARLVLRLIAEFDGELLSCDAPTRAEIARLVADRAIPDQLDMLGGTHE